MGRRRELDSLRSWLAAARDGHGRLVLCVGEPGVGKTRLAQELTRLAVGSGIAAAWGRCVEDDGAPAYWPWRQVLASLGLDADAVLAGDAQSPEDRFRLFDAVTASLRAAAEVRGLVVVLDDVHWSDRPSLLLLRHLADRVGDARLLVYATMRDLGPSGPLARVLPDLLRSPASVWVPLRGYDLAGVREVLSRTGTPGPPPDPAAVLDLTDGNPLFVREVARAVADGSWRPDRPPRTVLDLVAARLAAVSAGCRRLVQAAAVIGRDFPLPLVAVVLETVPASLSRSVDEAVAHGFVERAEAGPYRFVHALIRDAVEASLTTAERARLHRAAAEAIERQYAGDLAQHLPALARHWAELVPHGEGATAREWTVRAADEAVRQLAYEEAVRLYRAALHMDAPPPAEADRCRLLVASGRANLLAGDVRPCVEDVVAGAEAARAAADPELLGSVALVLEAVPDPAVHALATQLCDEALAALDGADATALRSRLLAQRSHLAFYDGDQERVASLSAAALATARATDDPHALVDALRARKEACPGPSGREERMRLAAELVDIGHRTATPRTAMWGEIWRIEGLLEAGRLVEASDELSALGLAVDRVGGPVSSWHLDRVTACTAQARGRFAEALAAGRRARDRMHPVEPGPARGTWFALCCVLSRHVVLPEAEEVPRSRFDPLPRFRTLGPLMRALLFCSSGQPEEAGRSYAQAGPLATWTLPAFYAVHGEACATLVAADLGRTDDLPALLARLQPSRGTHAVAEGVCSLGPVELALGIGAAALDRLDDAVEDLTVAADRAARAGALGFAAEAGHHLATTLLRRDRPGDLDRARTAAVDSDRLAHTLGMSAYVARTTALVAHLGRSAPPILSARETEVANLVASGLTNRQIGARLGISERTAQNHVQHVLGKLGFRTRSQIAAWRAGLPS
ncbi:ATP-binding protein [Geodermatophilus sp. CPCC 205761]|uniref:ATP-binding protein n=1 Tax=Geodermatophilus sp. CPCC 205761 TaxID=2936597 RepID=UPI003EE8ED13